MISQMGIKIDGLDDFLSECENKLLNVAPLEFLYPRELRSEPLNESLWTDKVHEIKSMNEKRVLSKLRNKANIYAIFIQPIGGDWSPVYIGQRKALEIRQRITSHLINKNEATGSKLAQVKESVAKGHKIGLRFLFLERDTMRAFVEEELIARNKEKLEWNKHA